MTDVQVFSNGKFEIEFERHGDTFTTKAPPLAKQLGFYSAKDMLRTVPDHEKGWETAPTLGGDQRIWHLTEPGFYRVVGQRQVSRIKDPRAVADITDFQDWVFGEVLPEIRRTGGYSGKKQSHIETQPRNSMEKFFEPNTYTWEEVAALIHQRTGIPLTVNEMTRLLRTGGVLKQTGAPTKKYRHLFWFTGSSWNVHPHVMPELTFKVFDTGRELQDFRFIQARLELEGVGASVPAQRQPGMQAVRQR